MESIKQCCYWEDIQEKGGKVDKKKLLLDKGEREEGGLGSIGAVERNASKMGRGYL